MKTKCLIMSLVLTALSWKVYPQQESGEIKLMTASAHPMQYYISLPKNWTPSKQWPAVMIFEGADKLYRENLQRFIDARSDMPFIIVAPIHTNNGNQGRRDSKVFPYSTETWDYIDKVGDCKFNDDGIRQILADIQNSFNAEEKFYATGFEAGAHMVWYLILNHPELLKGAAPVACNYRARCVDETAISKDPSKAELPVRGFVAENDEGFGPRGTYYNQWIAAKDVAKRNGYKNVEEVVVKNKAHEPLPKEVLTYFNSLLK